MNFTLLTLTLTVAAADAGGPRVERLWPNGAPGAVGTEERDRPSLTVYLPPADRATGTAVVVCPGGGYGGLAVGHEGKDIADWLNKHGVAAFVLRYRLGPRYHHPAPLQDAQRAIRIVRSRAKEWNVGPHRVGIWGFSAGGHLASTAATHFDDGKPDAADPVERVGCRPDFAVLGYPVITLKPPYAHMGSRHNLLGDKPDARLVESLCNETQVTARTPMTFLFHTSTDTVVPPENSALFYLALRKAGVPAEVHIYEKGPHGVGLAPNDPVLSTWPTLLAGWLRGHGLLVTPGQKKEFLNLLKTLPAGKGESFSEEAVKRALPYLPVLLALAPGDLKDRDLSPLLTLSRGLSDYRQGRQRPAREYAAVNFDFIRHPVLKLRWAAMLYNEKAASKEMVRFLREALRSPEQKKLLQEMEGPAFEEFARRLGAES